MIDYQNELNPAQYEAATTLEGPVLVIAGAGSGKTRTIVYRLAHLVESGVPAASILLLTFTRKAAQEMLDRARILLEQRGARPALNDADYGGFSPGHSAAPSLTLAAVAGGTFHSYAFSVLRLFQPLGFGKNLTVMDNHDMLAGLQHCRESLKFGKGDRTFPKNQTILGMLSKSRNKELPLEDVVRRDAQHLLPHAESMSKMGGLYAEFKREKSLLDYDDLLFELERALQTRPEVLAYCRKKHQYIMVDEYQDTNPVQARIAALIAGGLPGASALPDDGNSAGLMPAAAGNIMVVGDDAQSIYAFRGADVRNILCFPDLFPGAKIIRLEENYRSSQPVLDLCNAVLDNAAEGFDKRLYTRREGSTKPNIIRPISDRTQATLVAARIVELMGVFPAREIAVLFRSGYHSYHVEIQLNKLGIRFRKYGGIRYAEAAHVKDAMSFVRLIQNPLDFTAFARMAELSKGVGTKTCLKLYQLALAGNTPALAKAVAKYPELAADLTFIDAKRSEGLSPALLLGQVVDHYKPRLEILFPDDHPRRMQGLEQLVLIATAYTDLDVLVADLSLDDPMREEEEHNIVVLSTIHSAKGLEWMAVLMLDLVEERFPSRHSMARPDDFEEERRLMYVACTRAREHLEIFVPSNVFDRVSGGSIPAVPSPFVRELSPALYTEWQEGYTGDLTRCDRNARAKMRPPAPSGFVSAANAVHSNIIIPKNDAFFDPDDDAHHSPANTSRAASRSLAPRADPRAIGNGEAPQVSPNDCGYCTHRVFGRGKIVQFLPPDKYRVNFPGVGLKVIMAAYITKD